MSKKRNRVKKKNGKEKTLKTVEKNTDVSVVFELDKKKSHTPKAAYSPCHKTHPTLKLGKGELHGASCCAPLEGYDIYVGLDHGMERQEYQFPWNPPVEAKYVEVYFPITDGSVPKADLVPEFKSMVSWLIERLHEGKRIHAGCIGGHGRTGLLFSAILKEMEEEEDAIVWVRKNYCEKAVETTVQIEFLHKHYGVKKAKPSKSGYGQGSFGFSGGHTGYYNGADYQYGGEVSAVTAGLREYKPMKSEKKNIWSF